METILQQLAGAAGARVARDQQQRSLAQLQLLCRLEGPPGAPFRFEQQLRQAAGGLAFICEVKKASPSKGVISPDFPYLDIAGAYEAAGADALSCLTEPRWFLGSDQIFEQIRRQVTLPMLRKDFTVDVYQIYQARLMGADAVLLICALLDEATLAAWLEVCEELGLTALVEAHDQAEIRMAVTAGARVIGVNNRNLRDFSVHQDNCLRLRDLVPPDRVFVAESGIQGPETVAALAAAGVDALLIGEAFMRAPDPGALLATFRQAGAGARPPVAAGSGGPGTSEPGASEPETSEPGASEPGDSELGDSESS
ncbi:indole-3-glycerol phosphate synthase TrpC [Oscillospiraceae bacterium HV4-5-C5C]|nr:indole-3-glycerol phosphate synthase TrpC [Oscillospiraceae bacterium HV4-5-C5C]